MNLAMFFIANKSYLVNLGMREGRDLDLGWEMGDRSSLCLSKLNAFASIKAVGN